MARKVKLSSSGVSVGNALYIDGSLVTSGAGVRIAMTNTTD
jgi:hypothetical protein